MAFQTGGVLLVVVFLVALLLSFVNGDDGQHDHDVMSKHFVLGERHLAGATTVVMAADAQTTQGPFFDVESDYVNSTDLTAAARAGSPGVTANRASVLQGIPINLTLGFSRVTTSGVLAGPLVGAKVFIWHADTSGVYSAVNSRLQSEITAGQVWLRAVQTTSTSDGIVFFRTILPGWYPGRAVHWHLRVKLPGVTTTTYVATSQLFVSDAFVNAYSTVSPYSKVTNRVTYLASDNVYSSLNSDVGKALVLEPVGSTTAGGYKASINFGIVAPGTTSPPTFKPSVVVPTTKPTSKPVATPTQKPANTPTKKPTSRPRRRRTQPTAAPK